MGKSAHPTKDHGYVRWRFLHGLLDNEVSAQSRPQPRWIIQEETSKAELPLIRGRSLTRVL